MKLVFAFRMTAYCLVRPLTWPWVLRRLWALLRLFLFSESVAVRKSVCTRMRDESRSWYAARAIDSTQLAERVPFPFISMTVEKRYPEVIARARKRRSVCPIEYGGPANVDLLYSLAKSIRARAIVETGVAFGWSSLAFLLALRSTDADDHILMSVDMPFVSQWSPEWTGGAVPSELRRHWRLYRIPDRQGLPYALQQGCKVDIGHYDSDKSCRGRMFGYRMIWKSLRRGGILVSDDIEDNSAFKEFSEEVVRTPIVIEWNGKYQGLLIK